jgi:hypothetical protein
VRLRSEELKSEHEEEEGKNDGNQDEEGMIDGS